jgi:proteic killer suppression protein
MRGEYGPKLSDKLQQRLSELSGVATLQDMRELPAARCHELTSNLAGKLAIDLNHPFRLIFSPAHDPIPRKTDGGLDWSGVTAVCIEDVVDYH